jgi:hypothetical protein
MPLAGRLSVTQLTERFIDPFPCRLPSVPTIGCRAAGPFRRDIGQRPGLRVLGDRSPTVTQADATAAAFRPRTVSLSARDGRHGRGSGGVQRRSAVSLLVLKTLNAHRPSDVGLRDA